MPIPNPEISRKFMLNIVTVYYLFITLVTMNIFTHKCNENLNISASDYNQNTLHEK